MKISVKKAYLPGSVEFKISQRPLVDAVAWVAVRWGCHRISAVESFTAQQISEAVRAYHFRGLAA